MKKIRSEILEMTICEDFGGKIISFKDSSKEYLFLGNSKIKPDSDSLFESGFDYGLDECFPTIDQCLFLGVNYKDHGDLWRSSWDLSFKENSFTGRAYSNTSKLNFKRVVTLEKNKARFDYEIENKNNHISYFLYTLHPLFNFDPDSYFSLPFDKYKIFNVKGMDELKEKDICELRSYESGKTYKFYNDQILKNNKARIFYPAVKKVLSLEFDKNILPYFAIWISKEKGKENMALEPSNGFYDRLDRAVGNGLKPIKPHEKISFTTKIKIERMD